MKTAPSNLSNCKISIKKYLNLGRKMPYLGIFFDWNLKRILSYLKSAPSNLSKYKFSARKKNG